MLYTTVVNARNKSWRKNTQLSDWPWWVLHYPLILNGLPVLCTNNVRYDSYAFIVISAEMEQRAENRASGLLKEKKSIMSTFHCYVSLVPVHLVCQDKGLFLAPAKLRPQKQGERVWGRDWVHVLSTGVIWQVTGGVVFGGPLNGHARCPKQETGSCYWMT